MAEIGAIGGATGGAQSGGNVKQVFQDAKALAPNNQGIQADLDQITQARQQAKAQEAQGAAAGSQTASTGQPGGTTDQSQLSSGAQGISAAGPSGVNPQQKEEMHAQMAPYIQKLTQDVATAQQGGGAGQAPQTQQQPQVQAA